MNTIAIWILLAISNGGYNHGTITVIDRFPSAEACANTMRDLKADRDSTSEVMFRCVRAEVVR